MGRDIINISKELYKNVVNALYFLQLQAMNHIDKINDEELVKLVNMRLNGWDYKKTNDIINSFVELEEEGNIK